MASIVDPNERKERILFICNCNLNRSPTFEKWFKNYPEYEVRSAGIHYGYPYQVNKEILDWADKVFIMDLEQAKILSEKYPEIDYEIIGVSDQYDPDDFYLIRLIEFWFKKIKKKHL